MWTAPCLQELYEYVTQARAVVCPVLTYGQPTALQDGIRNQGS